MKKIINDTLKKANGKWDKQALTFFVSFHLSIVLGVTNLICSYVLGIVNNPTADNVFNSFMLLTATLSGINVGNKLADYMTSKKEAKQNNTNENTEE